MTTTVERLLLSWRGDRVLIHGPALPWSRGLTVDVDEAFALARMVDASAVPVTDPTTREVTAEGYTFRRVTG